MNSSSSLGYIHLITHKPSARSTTAVE